MLHRKDTMDYGDVMFYCYIFCDSRIDKLVHVKRNKIPK